MQGGDVLLVVLVLLLGCAAFVFGVIYVVVMAVVRVGRAVVGIGRLARHNQKSNRTESSRTARACPHERCGHVEDRREARYCSQCGTPLTRHSV